MSKQLSPFSAEESIDLLKSVTLDERGLLLKARKAPVKYYKKEGVGKDTRYYYTKEQYDKAKGKKKKSEYSGSKEKIENEISSLVEKANDIKEFFSSIAKVEGAKEYLRTFGTAEKAKEHLKDIFDKGKEKPEEDKEVGNKKYEGKKTFDQLSSFQEKMSRKINDDENSRGRGKDFLRIVRYIKDFDVVDLKEWGDGFQITFDDNFKKKISAINTVRWNASGVYDKDKIEHNKRAVGLIKELIEAKKNKSENKK